MELSSTSKEEIYTCEYERIDNRPVGVIPTLQPTSFSLLMRSWKNRLTRPSCSSYINVVSIFGSSPTSSNFGHVESLTIPLEHLGT